MLCKKQEAGICRVRFDPTGELIEFDSQAAPFSGTGRPGSILDIALANEVVIEHGCGGTGVCGMCAVEILRGMTNLSKPTADEQDTLKVALDDTRRMRLACQAIVLGDVTVRIVS